MLPQTFPIARYRLQFQVSEPFILPEYAGSALRGTFGRALRKIACMTKQAECKTCPLYRSCPYTNIFETPPPPEHSVQKFSQVPNGYVIEPPEWGKQVYEKGELFSFEIVLFGRLISQLALIIFAFKRGMAFNIAQGKAELTAVFHLNNDGTMQSILQDNQLLDHQAEMKLPENLPDAMTIEISTPLRIQENGKRLSPDEISAERFFTTLAKRLSLLAEFHAEKLDLDISALKQQALQIQDQKNLTWQNWTRFSSRQNQKMNLNGVVGIWQFEHLSEPLRALLYLGQWLHCGKNATFGLGKYHITNL